MTKSNLIQVTQSSMPSKEEYFQEVSSIWETKWLTNMGSKHNQLQSDLKDYLGIENIELMVNGHMSIEMGIQAFDFPVGSEIITTPFTFASTTHAIARNNLEPVFCDIEPEYYTIDVNKIEEKITDRTVAIMPVHVFGNVCDVEAIDDIAQRHDLAVLYDAAHSFGETYKGKSTASFGDMSFFSFHATKVFNTIEGGAVCFKDEKFSRILYDLKNFGIHGPEEVQALGGNAKMNEFCAAMGICNLRHLDREIEKREKLVNRYFHNLDGIAGIKLNKFQEHVKSNYSYFPIVFDEKVFGFNRDKVKDRLQVENIFSRKYFYPLTNSYGCYKRKYDVAETPVALSISNNVLCLPLYADLEIKDVDRICEIISQ